MTRDEAAARLAIYAPTLAADFPPEAFTADSLSHVAKAANKGFPPYGELYAALSAWWRNNRPHQPALPEPAPPDPPPHDPQQLQRIHAIVQTIATELAPSRFTDQAYRPQARYLTTEQLQAARNSLNKPTGG